MELLKEPAVDTGRGPDAGHFGSEILAADIKVQSV
jgi:hypothetical protein